MDDRHTPPPLPTRACSTPSRGADALCSLASILELRRILGGFNEALSKEERFEKLQVAKSRIEEASNG